MRIALISETFLPKWDGVATVLCHVLEHLAVRGHESILFAPMGAPERYAQTPIIGLPSFSFPLYPDLRLVIPAAIIAQRLAEFEPDVVHLVNPAIFGLVGLFQARLLGLPIVASYHTDIPGYARRYGLGFLEKPLWAYFRFLHNGADLNLCPSQYTQAELERHGFQRVRVLYHGVDVERFSPAKRDLAWRERLTAGNPKAPLLLYVGRLATEKRVHWLLPVIEALAGARLAIVGDGPIRGELERAFAGTPTVFTGYLAGDDLAAAFASADVFCFPSANETFGMVVLEAMASGLPVVAPRSGGVVDHVRDGVNGYLFEPDDCEACVWLVERLVRDRELAARLGRGALNYAHSMRWEPVLDDLINYYAATAASRARPHYGAYLGRAFRRVF